jgi:type I restriction enzyme, S subunit
VAYKQVRLGDYFKFEKGLGYKGEFLAEESDVALIGMDSHDEGGGYKGGSEKPYSGAYKEINVAYPGDVIFAATDLTQDGRVLGSPLLVPESDEFQTYIYSHHLLKAFQKKEGFLPEFLYNLYRVEKFRRKAAYADSGTTVRALPAEVLEEQIVPLPDLPLQQAINDFIAMIDQQIANNKALSKSLETLAQAMFKSWFIDFDPVHAKSKGKKPFGMDESTASLFPSSFEKSDSGDIPTGWSECEIATLFDVAIGRTPPRKESEWFSQRGEGVPWVSIRDMGTYSVYSDRTNECLTPEAVQKFRVPVVPEHSVLMSFKLTVGKVCITSESVVTNEAIAHFKQKDANFPTTYCYLWLKLLNKGSLESTSSIGTATNSQFIKKIPILKPNQEIMNEFTRTIKPVFDTILKLQSESNSLTELIESALPDMIHGVTKIPSEIVAS